MATIEREQLQRALEEELREAWRALRSRYPQERFYGFGLYTTDLVEYLQVTAFTEEGLGSVAARYAQRSSASIERARAALRWSPCDSPAHCLDEHALSRSRALRESGPGHWLDDDEAADFVAMLFGAAVQALSELDRQGLFGTGAAREQLVLGIFKADQSDDERTEFVRLLNSERVARRFERELAAAATAIPCE